MSLHDRGVIIGGDIHRLCKQAISKLKSSRWFSFISALYMFVLLRSRCLLLARAIFDRGRRQVHQKWLLRMIFFPQCCNSRQIPSRWYSCIFFVLGSREWYRPTLLSRSIVQWRLHAIIMQVLVHSAHCVSNCLFLSLWQHSWFVHF